MEIPFLKWDGGSLMTLGMGIKHFNSSGYKKVERKDQKGPGAYVQNTLGTMLSFISRTELVAFGWRATAPFP